MILKAWTSPERPHVTTSEWGWNGPSFSKLEITLRSCFLHALVDIVMTGNEGWLFVFDSGPALSEFPVSLR